MSDIDKKKLLTIDDKRKMYMEECGLNEMEARALTTPIKEFFKDREAVAFALAARDKLTEHYEATKTGEWRKNFKHDF